VSPEGFWHSSSARKLAWWWLVELLLHAVGYADDIVEAVASKLGFPACGL
jgi:hypothetical protein